MWKKELERIRSNPDTRAAFKQAVDTLDYNRIFYFLRLFGRPTRDTHTSQEQLAVEASWSAGWNDCLDTILQFDEIFIAPEAGKSVNPKADYGGRRRLLEEGIITEEEFKNGYTDRRSDAKHGTARNTSQP